jgi:site-specific DNA-methyltransferase (adenine-specific)
MEYNIYQWDAVAALQGLAAESVDLIITDPAYESLEKHRSRGTTTRLKHSKASSNDWFTVFPNVRFENLFREAWRVLKKDRHFYLMCDSETMFIAKPIAEAVGFKFWKPIVWNKMMIGMGYHYRAQTEFILFFEKGKRKLNSLSISDFLDEETYTGPDSVWAKRLRGGDVYPTEKPVELAEVLILQSTQPGELVVDPFMGSGSTGEAALRNNRNFFGADICSEAVGATVARLQQVCEGSSDAKPRSP